MNTSEWANSVRRGSAPLSPGREDERGFTTTTPRSGPNRSSFSRVAATMAKTQLVPMPKDEDEDAAPPAPSAVELTQTPPSRRRSREVSASGSASGQVSEQPGAALPTSGSANSVRRRSLAFLASAISLGGSGSEGQTAPPIGPQPGRGRVSSAAAAFEQMQQQQQQQQYQQQQTRQQRLHSAGSSRAASDSKQTLEQTERFYGIQRAQQQGQASQGNSSSSSTMPPPPLPMPSSLPPSRRESAADANRGANGRMAEGGSQVEARDFATSIPSSSQAPGPVSGTKDIPPAAVAPGAFLPDPASFPPTAEQQYDEQQQEQQRRPSTPRDGPSAPSVPKSKEPRKARSTTNLASQFRKSFESLGRSGRPSTDRPETPEPHGTAAAAAGVGSANASAAGSGAATPSGESNSSSVRPSSSKSLSKKSLFRRRPKTGDSIKAIDTGMGFPVSLAREAGLPSPGRSTHEQAAYLEGRGTRAAEAAVGDSYDASGVTPSTSGSRISIEPNQFGGEPAVHTIPLSAPALSRSTSRAPSEVDAPAPVPPPFHAIQRIRSDSSGSFGPSQRLRGTSDAGSGSRPGSRAGSTAAVPSSPRRPEASRLESAGGAAALFGGGGSSNGGSGMMSNARARASSLIPGMFGGSRTRLGSGSGASTPTGTKQRAGSVTPSMPLPPDSASSQEILYTPETTSAGSGEFARRASSSAMASQSDGRTRSIVSSRSLSDAQFRASSERPQSSQAETYDSATPPPISIPSGGKIAPRDDESPDDFMARAAKSLDKSEIAVVLSSHGHPFYQEALQACMRRFQFAGNALDIALRKLLMEVCLPKETQQIDRVMEAFAIRYCECNEGLFLSHGEPLLPRRHDPRSSRADRDLLPRPQINPTSSPSPS